MDVKLATDKYPLFLPEPTTPRSSGVHVSSIIRCIATEAGILTPDDAEELSLQDVRSITDEVAILRISIGLAVEQQYIPQVLSHYGVKDHPGEMLYDGVYMTHDGEDTTVIITLYEGGRYQVTERIHEVKATYKSTKTVGDLRTQWMWLAQIKAYCKAKGVRFAVLHVWFLCGDYKYPISPKRLVWEIEFTQEEIDDNWELLSDYRDQYEVLMQMEADLRGNSE